MLLAIDYDFTYTEDPDLWDRFILDAQTRGHKVICVTGRTEPPCKNKERQFPDSVEIVCAGDQEKRVAAEIAGHIVNVWIDDMPETISPCVSLQWE